jgi:hypothetical protein
LRLLGTPENIDLGYSVTSSKMDLHFVLSSTVSPEYKKSIRRALERSGKFNTVIVYNSLDEYMYGKVNSPYFLEVKVESGYPNAGGMIWSYISWSFLTIIPAYYSSELSMDLMTSAYIEWVSSSGKLK